MHRLQFLLDIEKKYGRRAPKTKDFVQFNVNSLFKKMHVTRAELRELGDEISDRGLDSKKYNSSDIPENQKTHFSEFLLSIHRLDPEGTTVWKEFFNITDKCSLKNIGKNQFAHFMSDKVALAIDLTENMGLGLNYSLGASFVGGAELSAMLEMINFNNKLTLYCSAGAGVTFGAEANGSSLTGSVIRTFGCGDSKNYRGGFLSVSVGGSYGAVVKGQISFGVKAIELYKMITDKDFYSQIYEGNKNISEQRREVLYLFKEFLMDVGKFTFNKYLKNTQQHGGIKGTLEFFSDEIRNRDALSFMIQEYLNYLEDSYQYFGYEEQEKMGKLLLSHLGKHGKLFFTGCNAISVEVGAGASAGASGGLNYSHYIDVNQRGIDLKILKQMSFDVAQRATALMCDPSWFTLKKSFSFLGNKYLKRSYAEMKEFAVAIANAPYRCTGLKHIVDHVVQMYELRQ